MEGEVDFDIEGLLKSVSQKQAYYLEKKLSSLNDTIDLLEKCAKKEKAKEAIKLIKEIMPKLRKACELTKELSAKQIELIALGKVIDEDENKISSAVKEATE